MSRELKKHGANHPNDLKPPKGFQYVRVDGYDPRTPGESRVYVKVPTGYGEGARAIASRGGLVNFRKVFNVTKKRAKTGRRVDLRLPPMSRTMRNLANAAKAEQEK